MSSASAPLWTLDELGAKVAVALAVDYEPPRNGQVRDVPDVRTIRYYTTLGLLDRPAAMRGRTALYHQRHLLQLVAIKRLQARGLTLAQIQQRLLGLPTSKLRELARLPAGLESLEPEAAPPAEAAPPGAFWQTPPAPASTVLAGVPLAEGATLLLNAKYDLDEEDLAALRTAAAPLLKWLKARRLIGTGD
jgi:DNA-binding transcriptional MerR regulator